MKTKVGNFLLVSVVLLTALSFTGRQPKPDASEADAAVVEFGPKYSPKNGLLVPSATRQSLGLKIVDVTGRNVPATIGVQLRVYDAGEQALLATGSVTPDEAKALKKGQQVHARVNDVDVVGRVIRVDGELQKATGLAEVLVEFRSPPERTGIGAFLSARVALEPAGAVVTIPRAALLECSDGASVYAVSGEAFVRTPVKVGALTDDFAEIQDGLYAGDQVVLQPVMALWMTELAAVKGGQACCAAPARGK